MYQRYDYLCNRLAHYMAARSSGMERGYWNASRSRKFQNEEPIFVFVSFSTTRTCWGERSNPWYNRLDGTNASINAPQACRKTFLPVTLSLCEDGASAATQFVYRLYHFTRKTKCRACFFTYETAEPLERLGFRSSNSSMIHSMSFTFDTEHLHVASYTIKWIEHVFRKHIAITCST